VQKKPCLPALATSPSLFLGLVAWGRLLQSMCEKLGEELSLALQLFATWEN